MFVFFDSNVGVFKLPQGFEFEEGGVDAEPQKRWWWTVEVNNSDVRLTLGTFASLVILLLVVCFQSGVIYVVKIDFWVFLIDNFDSILNASPEGGEPGLRLEFGIKGEESGATNGAMVESGLVLGPEHASERSLHGFGFDQVSLVGGEFHSFRFV